MYLRSDHGEGLTGGGASALAKAPAHGFAARLSEKLADFEFAPDLGSRIGSLTWYRGAATCVALITATLLLAPGFENPIYGSVPAPVSGAEFEATQAQAIKPLGMGSTTGTRMAATGLVAPLTDTPERPIIELDTKYTGSLLGSLLRSGVGKTDANMVEQLVTKAVASGDLQPGTMLDLTLGRRVDKSQPRPLEKLAMRARFDLAIEVARNGGALSLKQIPIAIDRTPLRIQGTIGSSLYRSARAAGAPAKAVESYIKTLATRTAVSRLGSDCKFDIIVGQARAATGEVQLGSLMYAGVNGCASKVQLAPFEQGGKTSWFDGGGKGNSTGAMAMPANGRFSSGFGMRRHPILGYTRMHKGVDIAAPWGSPVFAASDGVVQIAGRSSGYGNFIKVSHGNGYGTGYGHLSRIYVRSGEHVRRGQRIGAVGNTGLSTGPHLHYELYRNGVAVNPRSVSFNSTQQLTGGDLGAFRAQLGRLLAVPVGHGAVKDAED
ncbi:murein DD-endopeptidase MepM/ murein hydrolase activator NlpD [Sphingomonas kyeonggiensis]|uniref:Murein DD-endopeptidase MepM/ murein hydrolase activator NlpD n=1 Tax=Sphingomonas kyeonggiensis TaxID=1268553 RepID=A0A7W7NQD1_9SPHN|nr:M23 family metallopeptidase [Sphingomonas kyeonggiensis]MBB4837768.1 murein DD-endopeptidase MepM/ murein hydrolase activator NlpD [Sphingomonas kyeonggiensis]